VLSIYTNIITQKEPLCINRMNLYFHRFQTRAFSRGGSSVVQYPDYRTGWRRLRRIFTLIHWQLSGTGLFPVAKGASRSRSWRTLWGTL